MLITTITSRKYQSSPTDMLAAHDLDLLTLGSMHAEQLPYTVRLPILVLLARAVFLSASGQMDRQTHTLTQLITLPMARRPPACVNR